MKQKTITLNQQAPRSIKTRKIAIETIVAILLIIWLHTSISKLLDFAGLKIQMQQSPVFYKHALAAAIVGPSLEIFLSIMLVFKKTRLFGMIGSCMLMLFFSWYVFHLMTTMPNLPCSCGGVIGFLNWPQHLVLNIFLTVISFVGIILIKQQSKFETAQEHK